MREEIRLGNEALARDDLETARQCFQQLLAAGGTPTQERIAANRLRDIQEKQEALRTPPPAAVRARVPRKSTRDKDHNEVAKRAFIRPSDNPVVEIRKH
jgi:hypothetical protein